MVSHYQALHVSPLLTLFLSLRRHEHLYEAIQHRLIRSDDLFDDKVATERLLGSSSIILCTVSMLSNPALDTCGVYDLVPVENLVIDEASQIDSFEFMVRTGLKLFIVNV